MKVYVGLLKDEVIVYKKSREYKAVYKLVQSVHGFMPSLVEKITGYIIAFGNTDRFIHDVIVGFTKCTQIFKYIDKENTREGEFFWNMQETVHERFNRVPNVFDRKVLRVFAKRYEYGEVEGVWGVQINKSDIIYFATEREARELIADETVREFHIEESSLKGE